MLPTKNPKKMHTNLIKYQMENCPTLPGRNLISTCNRRVKTFSAGRVEISSRQAGIMYSLPKNLHASSNKFCETLNLREVKSFESYQSMLSKQKHSIWLFEKSITFETRDKTSSKIEKKTALYCSLRCKNSKIN